MNVAELIAQLKNVDPDAEVRLAIQPGWPFEHRIADVVESDPYGAYEIVNDQDGEWGDEPGFAVLDVSEGDREPYVEQAGFASAEDASTWLRDKLEREGRVDPIVFIAEGGQLGYLPSDARSALGW